MVEQRRWYGGLSAGRAAGVLAVVAASAVAAVVAPAAAAAAVVPTRTVSFTTVGEHAFRVPLAVTSIHVVAIGGRGGSVSVPGGLGARVEADVRVSPGTTIYAEVGGNGAPAVVGEDELFAGGANGGGISGAWFGWLPPQGIPQASGGGGGGASDLQTCPVASCQPINNGSGALLLVAGGGAGAGADSQGGNGGTPNGDPGGDCVGGDGFYFGGGGGGGGYHCGAGGAAYDTGSDGGGGGSSYGPAGATYSVVSQDPSVTITYQTAFRLAPASRSSLTLDSVGGLVTQEHPSGASTQLWQLRPQGSLYQIVNLASGYCLATTGVLAYPLVMLSCDPTAQNKWQLPANFGAGSNGSLIWNPAYNLYVDVTGGSIAAGAFIDAWPYRGGYASQYFLTFPG